MRNTLLTLGSGAQPEPEVEGIGNKANFTFQGAHESAFGGTPDPSTISAPVSASNIDQLDGYRYLRFSGTLSYPLFPLPPWATTNPLIDLVRVEFRTPANCP